MREPPGGTARAAGDGSAEGGQLHGVRSAGVADPNLTGTAAAGRESDALAAGGEGRISIGHGGSDEARGRAGFASGCGESGAPDVDVRGPLGVGETALPGESRLVDVAGEELEAAGRRLARGVHASQLRAVPPSGSEDDGLPIGSPGRSVGEQVPGGEAPWLAGGDESGSERQHVKVRDGESLSSYEGEGTPVGRERGRGKSSAGTGRTT